MCRGDEALEAAASAVATLEPVGPSVELAWAYANLAGQQMMNAELAQAIELAQRAQQVAEPLGASEVLSDALNTEACCLADMDSDWTGPLRRALEIAMSSGHDEQAGRAFANLYSMFSAQRRFTEGERYFVDGVAFCDEHDITTFATCLRGERTSSLEKTGRWDDSVAMSIELLNNAGASPINRVCPLTRLGSIRARRGKPGAWECLDESMALAEGTGEPQHIVPVRVARAEAYWLEGESALARLEAELADDGCVNLDGWERGAVAVWLRRTMSDRERHGSFAEPYRALLGGDWERAAQVWMDLGCPFEAAMAMLDSTDDGALREALGIFAQLDAIVPLRITRQKMRTLGIRSIPSGAHADTRSHPRGLTRREREVLELITDGLTNAEISARLFISEKTVDHHVSAVLAKLGAPNRHVAASEARRLGLAGAGAGVVASVPVPVSS
jgi:DNA-binding CsgD family transcriptional regulator